MNKEQLNAHLARLGVSQSELARLLPANVSNVNRWARGRAPVPPIVAMVVGLWATVPEALVLWRRYAVLTQK